MSTVKKVQCRAAIDPAVCCRAVAIDAQPKIPSFLPKSQPIFRRNRNTGHDNQRLTDTHFQCGVSAWGKTVDAAARTDAVQHRCNKQLAIRNELP
jgi:hypothetical protein